MYGFFSLYVFFVVVFRFGDGDVIVWGVFLIRLYSFFVIFFLCSCDILLCELIRLSILWFLFRRIFVSGDKVIECILFMLINF